MSIRLRTKYGFEPSCSHLNFRFRACFKQGVPWHSGNYRVWIHSETGTWHDKNIQSSKFFSIIRPVSKVLAFLWTIFFSIWSKRLLESESETFHLFKNKKFGYQLWCDGVIWRLTGVEQICCMDIVKNARTFRNNRIYFNMAYITVIVVVKTSISLFGLAHFHIKFTAG